MEQNEMLRFLSELAANNSLEWMAAHRDDYRAAAERFENLLQRLIDRIAVFDPAVAFLRPHDLTFRLNRDTRFSKDKSPYRAAFRAHISPAGRLPIPAGYYLNLEPGNVFLGGGAHAEPFPSATAMVRRAIAAAGEAFQKIVSAPAFTENFILTGNKLKKVPAGYDAAHPQGEYLKYKSWDIECHMPDETLLDEEAFVSLATEKFRLMKPFNDYLNAALAGFSMPARG